MDIKNKRMGDLEVGDKLIGDDGEIIEVTEAYEEHIPERMYELTMEDGEVVKASGNHLWYCESDTDRKEKKQFKKAAKHYFKNNVIPGFDTYNPAYPIEIIGSKFSDDKKDQEFIKRVALALGPTVSTPSLTFDNYMDLVDEQLIFTYSYNDLINFLISMRDVVNSTKKGYFFFGKVRTTDEIYQLDYEHINIPHKADIVKGN